MLQKEIKLKCWYQTLHAGRGYPGGPVPFHSSRRSVGACPHSVADPRCPLQNIAHGDTPTTHNALSGSHVWKYWSKFLQMNAYIYDNLHYIYTMKSSQILRQQSYISDQLKTLILSIN